MWYTWLTSRRRISNHELSYLYKSLHVLSRYLPLRDNDALLHSTCASSPFFLPLPLASATYRNCAALFPYTPIVELLFASQLCNLHAARCNVVRHCAGCAPETQPNNIRTISLRRRLMSAFSRKRGSRRQPNPSSPPQSQSQRLAVPSQRHDDEDDDSSAPHTLPALPSASASLLSEVPSKRGDDGNDEDDDDKDSVNDGLARWNRQRQQWLTPVNSSASSTASSSAVTTSRRGGRQHHKQQLSSAQRQAQTEELYVSLLSPHHQKLPRRVPLSELVTVLKQVREMTYAS